jgi:hypothetical protein
MFCRSAEKNYSPTHFGYWLLAFGFTSSFLELILILFAQNITIMAEESRKRRIQHEYACPTLQKKEVFNTFWN